MTWTAWRQPTAVTVFEDDDINYEKLVTKNLQSISNISGIATGYDQLRDQSPDALKFSQFNFEPGIITDLEVKIHISRLARVQDLIIQLVDADDNLIGDNLADFSAPDIHTYGGAIQDWGLEELEASELSIAIDYQPHRTIPSSNLVYLRSVMARVRY